jgi:hypothetical protein
MTEFVPINWFEAGFKNPVEYFKYAMDFKHDFSNVIITKFTIRPDGCILTGVVLANTLPYYKFESIIATSENNYAENNEGDFEIMYNGLYYRICTFIDYDIDDVILTADMIDKSSGLLNHIILELFPKKIIKMAMIAVSLKL